MMQGFDRADAVAFMAKRLHWKEHPLFADRAEEMAGALIDADMAYMHAAGVLDEEGYAGDACYDDDDAIEAISDALTEYVSASDPETVLALVALADDYLVLQQQYLESRGLADWDD